MKEENNGYLGFALFFFFIVLLVVVGSILVYKNQKGKYDNTNHTENRILVEDKLKEDKDKDFIYYTSEEVISESLNFTMKKATINLKSESAKEANEELEEIYNQALTSVKKTSTENTCENDSDIYSTTTLNYANYTYGKYLTLLVSENVYSCQNEVEVPFKVYSYTFDGTTGNLIETENLLNDFSLTYTEVLQKIEEHLKENQSYVDGVPTIKIEETLNKLKENENYTIYIADTEKIVVNIIVKTSTVDYNDIIELN